MNRKLLLYSFLGIIGIILFIFTSVYDIEDSFWNGIAFSLICISLVRVYRFFKYKNDKEYAHKITVSNSDERNKFLADKAKGLAFYFYIVISGCLIIILRLLGFKEIGVFLAYTVCALVFLYCLIYILLKRKY